MNMKNRKVTIIGTRSAIYSTNATCYLSISFAKEYDYLYREDFPEENMVVLWKNSGHDDSSKQKLHKSCGNCLVNIKNTCLEGKMVFVTEDEEGYYLFETASKRAESSRKEPTSNIGPKYNFLFSEKERECLSYNDLYKKIEWFCSKEHGIYFTVASISEKIPKESCGLRLVGKRLKKKGYAVSYHEPGKSLYIPKPFREYAKIEVGDTLKTEIRNGKVFVMAADGQCAICKKAITRDKPIHIVKVCRKCHSTVKKSEKKIVEAFNTIEHLAEIN